MLNVTHHQENANKTTMSYHHPTAVKMARKKETTGAGKR